MFADAIEKVGMYTRPLKTITRNYNSTTVVPGAATLFFVNNEGWAITCKHVAELLIQTENINGQYQAFKNDCARLITDSDDKTKLIEEIERKYHYTKDTCVQLKNQFMDCVAPLTGFSLTLHPKYDLAILHLDGYNQLLYQGHAVFAKDSNQIKPGDYLCRLGYPFPEFSDFRYDPATDDIQWINGNNSTPRFPIDGMFTRHLADETGKVCGIELSTPGLRGQSGGPLFNAKGIVFGMQNETTHLHLGFDMINRPMRIGGQEQMVNNQPFLHVGHCIHVDIIKEFLQDNKVKFYVGNSVEEEEEINA